MTLLTKQERQELNYRLGLSNELQRRYLSNKIKWFTPNGKQDDFINGVGAGDVFIGIFSAANGVGKTALAMNMLGNMIYGKRIENEWFDYPIYKDFPFPPRGRIASTKKNVEEIGAIQTELKAWFPKGTYQTKKLSKNYDSEYQFDNGWVVDIMTYEQKAEEFESATLGVMIFDEPPPIKILNACIARMRSGGIILIFMTPLDDGGEILEDLTEKEVIESGDRVLGRVFVVYADIEDNCKLHGVRGQLEHDNIVKMVHFYDEEEKEARARGKPTHMVGRIYPSFVNEDPFVVDDFEIDKEWVRINILDPHDNIPFALSWAAIDPTGQIWIYDEFPIQDIEGIKSTSLTYPDYARIIREHESRDKIFSRVIDPYFGNKRYAIKGLTPKEELYELGFDFIDGDTSGIETGHKRVREFLKYDRTQPTSSLNHPKLHILKKCRNHWRAMLRYKKKVAKSGEIKDKIIVDETYKHFADNIRHLIMKYDELMTDYRIMQSRDDDMTSKMIGGGRGGW